MWWVEDTGELAQTVGLTSRVEYLGFVDVNWKISANLKAHHFSYERVPAVSGTIARSVAESRSKL